MSSWLEAVAQPEASQPDRNPIVPVPMPTHRSAVSTIVRTWGSVTRGSAGLGAQAPTQARKVSAMIHPSDPDTRRISAVRDGRDGPVTCAACGCRLSATGDAFFHFNPLAGRDARGCRITCADAAHDVAGRPIALAV